MPFALTTPHARLERLGQSESRNALRFFFCLAAAFCLDLLPGPYAVHFLFDVVQTAGMQAIYTGRQLLAHGPFGWDPSRWAGLPAGVAYSPPFGLHSVLLAFLPPWLFYSALKITLLTAQGFGLFRLLREYAQAPAPAALVLLVPSYLIMTSGQVVVVEAYSFPLVFAWTLDLARGEGGRAARLAKALCMALLFSMTCLVYVLPYFLPLAVMLALLAPAHAAKKRHLAVTALVWGGYFLMVLPLLWGFVDFLPMVNRVDHPGPPFHMGQALLGLALGTLGSFLSLNALPAVFCLPHAWRDARFRLLLAITLAYALVVAFLGSPLYEHFLAGTIMHKAHLYRAGMVLPYCQIILSGYAMSLALSRAKPLPRYSWGLAGLVAALAFREHSEARAIIGASLTALSFLCLQVFAFRQLAPRRGLMLALLALAFFITVNARQQEQTSDDAHDLYATGFGNHPRMKELARGLAKDMPGRPARAASIDLDPSIAKSYGFETLDGKFELTYMRFNDYMREVARPQFADEAAARRHFDNQMLLYVTPPLKPKEQRSHSFNKGLPRRLEDFNAGLLYAAGVQYLFSSKPVEGIEAFAEPLFTDPGRGLPLAALAEGTPVGPFYHLDIHAYQVREALGPAHFVSAARLAATPQEALALLAAAGPQGVRRAAVLAAPDLAPLDAEVRAFVEGLTAPDQATPIQTTSVQATRPSPDEIELRFTAAGPGLLVVSDNFDKGWSASLDGKPVPLLRADYAFQALPVDAAGEHVARLTFRAPLTLALYRVSLAGVLCILAAALVPGAPIRAPEATRPAPWRALALPELGGRAWLVLGLCALVWTVGFVKFVWFKKPPDGRPFWYIAATAPLVGLAVCALLLRWYGRLRR